MLNTNKTETRFKPKRKARKPGKLGDGAGGGRGGEKETEIKVVNFTARVEAHLESVEYYLPGNTVVSQR